MGAWRLNTNGAPQILRRPVRLNRLTIVQRCPA